MIIKQLIFSFLFFCVFTNAQKIQGKIVDENNLPLEEVTITFWDSDKKGNLIGFSKSRQDGSYEFQNQNVFTFIEVRYLGYLPINKKIDYTKSIEIDFQLKVDHKEIDEVVVKDKIPVRQKNDTTFYEPIKFLNGTEKNVEDLLKNLPGISVNESTGEIKFKGKSIETVNIENDDLFSGNYTLGTKNISVDMVEQVQAIEGFSKNPLLKNIEDSEKVAINLKIKKNKSDFSGELDLAAGYNDRFIYNSKLIGIQISKNIKSFGIFSLNNYGATADSKFYGNQNDTNLYSKRNINEIFLGNYQINSNRVNLNNTFFTNYNISTKLSNKANLKTNLIYFDDQLNINETSQTIFKTQNEFIEYLFDTNLSRRNKFFKLLNKITYSISSKSLMTYEIDFTNKNENSQAQTLQNKLFNLSTKLDTRDLFLKSNFELTHKLSKNQAFQFINVVSFDFLKQGLNSNPKISFVNQQLIDLSQQFVKDKKTTFTNEINHFLKWKNLKSQSKIGFSNTNLIFNSNYTENNQFLNDFQNNMNFNRNDVYFRNNLFYVLNKFKLRSSFTAFSVNQKLKNQFINEVNESQNQFLNFDFSVSYDVNKSIKIESSFNKENKYPSENYFFFNNIFSSNSNILKNTPSLELIKSNNYNLSLKYENLVRQFLASFSFNLNQQINGFISNFSIDPNFIITNNYQLPVKVSNKAIYFAFEKYINSLDIKLKLNSGYNLSDYFNQINFSQLRDNQSISLDNNLTLISLFDFPVNVEGSFLLNNNWFDVNKINVSKRNSIVTNFNINYKITDNLIFIFKQTLYKNDLKTAKNYLFLDCLVNYKSKKYSWLQFDLNFRNLLNIRSYTEITNSDYLYSSYNLNILPRTFFLSMSLKL